MVDGRGGASFAGEVLDEPRVAGQLFPEDFHGQIPVQRQVDGSVDRPHAADAEGIKQKKVAELERDDRERPAPRTFDLRERLLASEVNRCVALVTVDRFRHCARGVHRDGDVSTRRKSRATGNPARRDLSTLHKTPQPLSDLGS